MFQASVPAAAKVIIRTKTMERRSDGTVDGARNPSSRLATDAPSDDHRVPEA